MSENIIIIGASHAGISCAEQLRHFGFSGAIMLIDRQSGAPLERPPLSKSYLVSQAFFGSPLVEAAHEVLARSP